MQVDMIEAIGIDPDGSLWIRPSKIAFPMIYREAREVQWSHVQRCLRTPQPREWTYLDWFRHLLSVAKEAGTELHLAPDTEWVGIEEQLRRQFELV